MHVMGPWELFIGFLAFWSMTPDGLSCMDRYLASHRWPVMLGNANDNIATPYPWSRQVNPFACDPHPLGICRCVQVSCGRPQPSPLISVSLRAWGSGISIWSCMFASTPGFPRSWSWLVESHASTCPPGGCLHGHCPCSLWNASLSWTTMELPFSLSLTCYWEWLVTFVYDPLPFFLLAMAHGMSAYGQLG